MAEAINGIANISRNQLKYSSKDFRDCVMAEDGSTGVQDVAQLAAYPVLLQVKSLRS